MAAGIHLDICSSFDAWDKSSRMMLMTRKMIEKTVNMTEKMII